MRVFTGVYVCVRVRVLMKVPLQSCNQLWVQCSAVQSSALLVSHQLPKRNGVAACWCWCVAVHLKLVRGCAM